MYVIKERKVHPMANEKTKKQLHEGLRSKYMKEVSEYLEGQGEEVLLTNSNEICIPCVDENGNEEFMVLTFKVPTGSRDGEAYDGYSMAEDYAMKTAAKAEKTAKAKAAKEKKIAKDKAQREARAKAKADHEAKKGEG